MPIYSAELVLEDLVRTIEATGGLVQADDGDPGVLAPAGDPTWIDLGDTYLKACEVLQREPVIHEETIPATCRECGAEAEEFVNCPDGAKICRECFDAGAH
jgi:hypothetical protein